MKLITEYILKSQSERQNHLSLNEPCIEIGGNSTQFKALLAHMLKTTIPNGNKEDVILCHACHNGKCSNPKHLYWGTRLENSKDRLDNEKSLGKFKSPRQYTIEKHGIDKANKMYLENARKGASLGGKARKGKKLSNEHKENIRKGVNNLNLKKRK